MAEAPSGGGPEPAEISERQVQLIWHQQLIRADKARLEDGRRLRVLTPGVWSGGEGPDFSGAALRFGRGATVVGDVEVHLLASAWFAHGHHRDGRYNAVQLHVVWSNDGPRREMRRPDGAAIPILALERYALPGLGELAHGSVREDDEVWEPLGACHGLLRRCSLDAASRLLDRLGDARLSRRAGLWGGMVRRHGADATLYTAMFRALGGKAQAIPYAQVARRVPFHTVRLVLERWLPPEAAAVLHALFLGVAGLLPTWSEVLAGADGEALALYRRLRGIWEQHAPDLLGARTRDRAIVWPPSAVRPAALPVRRLAGMSEFLASTAGDGLLPACIAAVQREGKGWSERFRVASPSFWASRYSWTGRPLARPAAPIGHATARAILVDGVLPVLLAVARERRDEKLEQACQVTYGALGSLAGHTRLRRMKDRLFAGMVDLEDLKWSARRQQGLLELERWCDRARIRACRGCLLLPLLDVLAQSG